MREENSNNRENAWSFITRKISDIKQIVAPYFVKKNAFEIIAVIVANVVPTILSAYLTTQYALARQKSIENDEEDYTYSLKYSALALAPIIGISIRLTSNRYLGDSIRNQLRRYLISKLSTDNMMILKDHTLHRKDSTPTDITEIVVKHSAIFSNQITTLTIGSAGNIFNTITVLHTGVKTSGGKAVLVTSLISSAIALSLMKMENLRREFRESQHEHTEANVRILNHNNANRQQISSLNANLREQIRTFDNIAKQENGVLQDHSLGWLSMLLGMSSFSAYPQILRGLRYTSLFPDNISDIALDAFSTQALNLMSTLRDMSSSMTYGWNELERSMDRIRRLQLAIAEVHNFKENSPLKIHYNQGNEIIFDDFTLAKPPEDKTEELLQQVKDATSNPQLSTIQNSTLILKKGNTYQIAGESGLGKSTLLKTMTGDWPYAAGSISFPCRKDEIYFIPQETFMPLKASFLEALIYPRQTSSLLQNEVEYIANLASRLGLTERLENLYDETKKDWSILSRGEQQRIAIIRMVVHTPKPKILLIDEATSSVDVENAKIMQDIISENMSDATILHISHNDKTIETSDYVKSSSSDIFANQHIITFNKESKDFSLSEPNQKINKPITREQRIETNISTNSVEQTSFISELRKRAAKQDNLSQDIL